MLLYTQQLVDTITCGLPMSYLVGILRPFHPACKIHQSLFPQMYPDSPVLSGKCYNKIHSLLYLEV